MSRLDDVRSELWWRECILTLLPLNAAPRAVASVPIRTWVARAVLGAPSINCTIPREKNKNVGKKCLRCVAKLVLSLTFLRGFVPLCGGSVNNRLQLITD